MNVELLLGVIRRTGARVGISAGHFVTTGAPAELAPAIAEHGPALALAVAGHGTGHRWAACTTCGRPALIATGNAQPCRQTVRCDGKLKAYATPRPDPGLGIACARPGCALPAAHLTAWHEPICSADLLHLAYALDHRRTAP